MRAAREQEQARLRHTIRTAYFEAQRGMKPGEKTWEGAILGPLLEKTAQCLEECLASNPGMPMLDTATARVGSLAAVTEEFGVSLGELLRSPVGKQACREVDSPTVTPT